MSIFYKKLMRTIKYAVEKEILQYPHATVRAKHHC